MGNKLNTFIDAVATGVTIVAVMAEVKDLKEQKKNKEIAEQNGIEWREPSGVYEKYIKRPLDAVLSTGAAVALFPIMLVTAGLVRTKLGSPVIFTQKRPGLVDPATGQEKIFKLYKFRTMTDEKDADGNLLPDEVRLTKFGAWLRSTSLDELPELFNIIRGDMAVIGPRPQLVRDMVFMTDEQRKRHTVRPGLSGLAQVRGRNAISWQCKLNTDLEYIRDIGFKKDVGIILTTFEKVFKKEGINEEAQATALDYGDQLLKDGSVTAEEYNSKQIEAKKLLGIHQDEDDISLENHEPFSVSMCVYGKDNPEWFKQSMDSILNQTIIPDEIVLVVDGPVPEKLGNIISEFETNNEVKVIRFKENQGHGNARRAGLKACSNKLVALMDADDISEQNRFEQQLKEFQKDPSLDIVGGQVNEFIDDVNNPVSMRVVPCDNEDIKEYMKKRCPMNQPTVMFKKSAVEEVGGYIDWFCNEDYYLWIRLALSGKKFKNVASPLVNMRMSNDSYQRRGGWKYFKSEYDIQKLMLDKGISTYSRFAINVYERLVLQILMPNSVRKYIFERFARKGHDE